jgi:hypothetical protein
MGAEGGRCDETFNSESGRRESGNDEDFCGEYGGESGNAASGGRLGVASNARQLICRRAGEAARKEARLTARMGDKNTSPTQEHEGPSPRRRRGE